MKTSKAKANPVCKRVSWYEHRNKNRNDCVLFDVKTVYGIPVNVTFKGQRVSLDVIADAILKAQETITDTLRVVCSDEDGLLREYFVKGEWISEGSYIR